MWPTDKDEDDDARREERGIERGKKRYKQGWNHYFKQDPMFSFYILFLYVAKGVLNLNIVI